MTPISLRRVGARTLLVTLTFVLVVLSPLGARAASASTPSLSITENDINVTGGIPFAYSVAFTVTGASESHPITLTDTPSASAPGLTILSVPPQFGWNCSATDIAAQTVSCVYTPASPLSPGTSVSLSVDAVSAFSVGDQTSYQSADASTVSPADGGSVSADPTTIFNVNPNGVALNLALSDSLAGNPAGAGTEFDYLANLTVGGSGQGEMEIQPINITDRLPAGTVLTAEPHGTGWDCSQSVLTVPSKAICTYTPPAIGVGDTALPTLFEPAEVTDTNLGDTLSNTAQATSADTPGAQSTDTVTVGGTVPTSFLVTVTVSGSQVDGTSTPAFDYYGNDSAVAISGSLTCSTVNGGTPISASLGIGSYTIDGASCSGLSAPAGYTINYAGAHNDFFVSAMAPDLEPFFQTYGESGGVPFIDAPGFLVSDATIDDSRGHLAGGPESEPINVTFNYADFGPSAILSVPPQSSWNCQPPDEVAQTLSCVYTPISPVVPKSFVGLDIEVVAPGGPPDNPNLVGPGLVAYSSDATSDFSPQPLSVDPTEVIAVVQDGVALTLSLADSLGAGHSADTGTRFRYLADVTTSEGSAGSSTETQPITVTDPMPAGVVLTAQPYGTGWDCSASVLTSPSEAICTYTPPAVGLAGVAGLPTITMPARVTDPSVGDTLINTAQATSADTDGASATDSITVSLPPRFTVIENGATAEGGIPFTYPVGFTLSGTGGPESDPVTVSVVPGDLPPEETILSVPTPADPHWNCAGTDIVSQTVTCTYTPTAPIPPGTSLTFDVNAVMAYYSTVYDSTIYQEVAYAVPTSADEAPTDEGGEITNLAVYPDGVALDNGLSDSLGSGHSAMAGTAFNYLDNVTIGEVSAGAGPETQPVTVSDPLPTGVVLMGMPYGSGPSGSAWNCSASTLPSPSKAICTYTPPAAGLAQGTPLPTITMPAKVTDTNVGDTLSNTAQATSPDTAGTPSTDSFTVTGTITATVSGSQTYGSSAPTFTYSSNAPGTVTVSGPLGCTSVNGGTAINSSLPTGTYTVDGSSCAGLTPSDPDYAVSYAGANNGFVVSSPVSLTCTARTITLPAGTAGGLTTTLAGSVTVAPGQTYYVHGGTVTGNITVDKGATLLMSSGVMGGNVTFQGGGTMIALGGTVRGNLLGQSSSVSLANTTIDGNLSQLTGGSLVYEGVSIVGNLQMTGAASVAICGGSITGNLQIQGTSSTPPSSVSSASPTANYVCGLTIAGNLQITNSAKGAPFEIGGGPDCARGLTIVGNLEVQGNAGRVTVGGSPNPQYPAFSNVVQGNIKVSNNTGGGTLTDNKAVGGIQLSGNTPGIVGSGNVAQGSNTGNRTA